MEKDTDRIVVEISKNLKSIFKMALIYEGTNMKDKITQLVTDYTKSVISISDDEVDLDGKMKISLVEPPKV